MKVCMVVGTCLAVWGMGAAFGARVGGEVVWPGARWEEAKAEEVGMASGVLGKAREYALRGDGSGMVTRHGKVVMRWGDQSRRYDLKSSTKAIGFTAVGLALKDGKFKGLDERAKKYQPNLGIPPESNARMGWIDKITLFHLATQTAGFDKPGGYTKLMFEPGTKWYEVVVQRRGAELVSRVRYAGVQAGFAGADVREGVRADRDRAGRFDVAE